MTETPVGPHAWAEHYNALREQAPQPGRHTADTITDDDLDQLYDEIDRMKLLVAASSEPGHAVRMAAQYAERAIENGQRAEQAETAAANLRARLQATSDAYNNVTIALGEVLAAFRFDTHPGRRCKQSDHVPVETVERWRAALELKDPTP